MSYVAYSIILVVGGVGQQLVVVRDVHSPVFVQIGQVTLFYFNRCSVRPLYARITIVTRFDYWSILYCQSILG